MSVDAFAIKVVHHHMASLPELQWMVQRWGNSSQLQGICLGDDVADYPASPFFCVVALHAVFFSHIAPSRFG